MSGLRDVLPVTTVFDAADVAAGNAVPLGDTALVASRGSYLTHLLSSELRLKASLTIDGRCDELEMRHVDAAAISAQVIDLKFGRDWSVCLFPGKAMGQANPEEPITAGVSIADPDMTTTLRISRPEFVVAQPLEPRIVPMNEPDGMATKVTESAAAGLGKWCSFSTPTLTESRGIRRRNVHRSTKVVPPQKSDGLSLNMAIGTVGVRRKRSQFAAAALAVAVRDSIARHAASLLEVVCRGCRDPFSAPPHSTVEAVG